MLALGALGEILDQLTAGPALWVISVGHPLVGHSVRHGHFDVTGAGRQQVRENVDQEAFIGLLEQGTGREDRRRRATEQGGLRFRTSGREFLVLLKRIRHLLPPHSLSIAASGSGSARR
jgi:hypothetical protein